MWTFSLGRRAKGQLARTTQAQAQASAACEPGRHKRKKKVRASLNRGSRIILALSRNLDNVSTESRRVVFFFLFDSEIA